MPRYFKQSHLLALLFVALLTLAACSGAPMEPLPPAATTPADETVVPPGSDVPPANVITGTAAVDSLQILYLESFPVQIQVEVSGQLPDGCTQLDEPVIKQEGNLFQVELSTWRQADMMCTLALVPYTTAIALPVNGLAAGTYEVNVNGMTASFTLDVDNEMPAAPTTGDDSSAPVSGAYVDNVNIADPTTTPGELHITVEGNLADGCTTLTGTSQDLAGSDWLITLTTFRDPNLMCTEALVPFRQVIVLGTQDLTPGKYNVVVNGVSAAVEIPQP